MMKSILKSYKKVKDRIALKLAYKATITLKEAKMGDNTTITQKAAIGSDTIQIGTQNNNYYNGLTPTQASQLAINLFMDNFPKLQEAAMKTVQERVNELIREIVSKIEKNHAGDYSAFSMPDMQYILVEAEKGYARKGTPELCSILSSLIADRTACTENSYLETVLDKAIEVAPSLLPMHLDYLSLIFLYKSVRFGDISTLDDLANRYCEIHSIFHAPNNKNSIPYFDMLGLLTISLGNGDKVLSQMYGFNQQEVAQVLPTEYTIIPGDYILTPVGIVLAIFNAHSKWYRQFNLSTWIHE